jgi:hypothetical protein
VLWALVALTAATANAADAETRLDARVVWVSGDRAILAATDSLPLESGDALTFQERGRLLARGEVASVIDRGVAIAMIHTGSLAGVRRFDRVRVLHSPMPIRPGALRIGVPSRSRPGPLGPSDTLGVDSPAEAGYRAETVGEREIRRVREPLGSDGAWPDTLTVRRFDDAADEEIALERGEIDVAVFWPGEPSRALHEDDRHWRVSHGVRGVTLRCPIVYRPGLHRALAALGFDRLVGVEPSEREAGR